MLKAVLGLQENASISMTKPRQKSLNVNSSGQARHAAHFATIMVKSAAHADLSDIKSNFYSCSYSSNLPTTSVILDTGASITMSSEKSLFTNLTASKNSIHIANKDIIYSTHIGTFHIHTKLDNGKPITILIYLIRYLFLTYMAPP